MRGTPPSITVDVGPPPFIAEASSTRTTIRLANAQLILHGSEFERRGLVEELARCLGLRVETYQESALRVLEEGRALAGEPA